MIIIGLFLLTGCGELASDVSVQEIEKAHAKVQSLYVTENMTDTYYAELDYETVGKYNFKEEKSSLEMADHSLFLYQNADEKLVVMNGETLPVWEPSHEAYAFNMAYEMAYQQNPFGTMKLFDQSFYENFKVKETENSYTFTYIGDEDAKYSIIQGVVWSSNLLAHQSVEQYSELALTDVNFNLIAIVDKKTKRIELLRTDISYTLPTELNSEHVNMTRLQQYSKYNERLKIDASKYSEKFAKAEEEEQKEQDLLKEAKTYEKEASDYADALIQATVFQNSDLYAKKVPGKQSPKDKREEGKTHQESFRASLKEELMRDMGDFGVSEEEIDQLTDATLQALSKTKYKVVDAKFREPDKIRVNLLVSGLEDSRINIEVMDKLVKELEKGKLNEADLLKRNVEMLIEAYEENQALFEEREVSLEVMLDEKGQYRIKNPNHLLTPFKGN